MGMGTGIDQLHRSCLSNVRVSHAVGMERGTVPEEEGTVGEGSLA